MKQRIHKFENEISLLKIDNINTTKITKELSVIKSAIDIKSKELNHMNFSHEDEIQKLK
jgi:hypothetical protein